MFIAATIVLAGAAVSVRKPRFTDLQVVIMVIALAMSCDMIFCKQLKMYHYVDMSLKYIGWYSFWANFIAAPALGLVFIKFIPSKVIRITFYILIWSIVLTFLESYVLKPLGILYTPVWRTVPWSLIGYFIVLVLESAYFRILERRTA